MNNFLSCKQLNKRIKTLTLFFMAALLISGITAFDPAFFLKPLLTFFPSTHDASGTGYWLHYVYAGLETSSAQYPFLLYGYDWLAFAHIMIAILFIGVYKEPVRNKWVIDFAIISCIAILPFAFVCGHIRQIPIGWRLIDCSFGIFGLLPLALLRNSISQLEHKNKK
ncbi:MAG: hypothetical protein K2X48_16285 [Chitinophagaceae bacterium]|nr:hypothetical protein [Chitinophagaceae bacterium]